MIQYEGHCHCGNIALAFETEKSASEIPLRSCGCTFCQRHGGRYTSDPNGRVRFTFNAPDRLIRYRFGLKTADFLICGVCGVFVAAMTEVESRRYAVINVNCFDRAAELTGRCTAMDYDGENDEDRTARRTARWTPVVE